MKKVLTAACCGLLTLAASLFGDPLPPQITTTSLPHGQAFAPYNAQLTATNGTGTLAWSRQSQIVTNVVGWGNNRSEQLDVPAGLSNVVAISLGDSHGLALRSDGTVAAWGDNYYGQTNTPAALADVVAISAGGNFSLALKTDGSVVGWGFNDYGQTNTSNLANIRAVAAGGRHGLALATDGTVTAWGDSRDGQTSVPPELTNAVAIVAGDSHSLALTSEGKVVGWGYGSQVEPPDGLSNVVAVAAGNNHSLALKDDGTVVGWGGNAAAVPPEDLANVVAVAAGRDLSLALKGDGSVVGWGNGAAARPPISLADVIAIAVGYSQSLALATPDMGRLPPGLSLDTDTGAISGTPTQTGTYSMIFLVEDDEGRIASQTLEIVVDEPDTYTVSYHPNGAAGFVITRKKINYLPLALFEATPFKRAGYLFEGWNSAADGSGTAYAPGTDYTANDHITLYAQWTLLPQITTASLPVGKAFAPYSIQLGATNTIGALTWSLPPHIAAGVVGWGVGEAADIPAGLADDVIAISAGKRHGLALKSDSTVVAWGENSSGQTNVPASLSDVVAIAAGGYFSLALKSDGTVIAWGDNDYGQTNTPAALADVVAISAGGNFSLALKTDGTVVGWGGNWAEQASVPEDLSNVVAIAAGERHSLALKSDGTVVGWGDEALSTPPEGLSDVVAIAAGSDRDLALRSDGTIVQWSDPYHGHEEFLASPPADLSNVVAIAVGNEYSLALKSDGTIAGWGNRKQYDFGMLTPPESLTNAVAIATSGTFALAIAHTEMIPLPLPPGLSLDPGTGVISGTPTQPGTYSMEFVVTDEDGRVARQTLEIVIAEADIYTVSYDANGGAGSVASVTLTNAVSLTLSDGAGLSRFGYSLTGWNTAADGSGTAYALGGSYGIASDLTLYAQWHSLLRVTSLDLARGRLIFSALPDGTAGTVYTVEVSPTLVNAVWRPAISFSGVGPSALVYIYFQLGDAPMMFFRITAAPE